MTPLLLVAAVLADGLWDRYCLACHGERGDGNGPAAPYLEPRPRDLTAGRYKWRSTPIGKPPTDDDVARTLRHGAPGTSMPGYAGILTDAQIAALVTKVKSFAPGRFAVAAAPVAVPAPPTSPADGRAAFAKLGCVSCHGDDGRGVGAEGGRPFDLTASPLRRGDTPGDIYLTLVTGIDGTTMPAYPARSAADQASVWAVVAYVDSIRFRGEPPSPPPVTRGAAPVGLTLAPQGEPPAALPPAAASLSSAQCGRCHAKQLREWSGSLHASAHGPGVDGQGAAAMGGDCAACHSPLVEQRESPDLRAEGVTCAACHVRGHVRRGPPRRPDSALLPLPSYPFVPDEAYERSDFCLPCHQLPPSAAVAGRPLLDTYREWLHGPYQPRGVQCQHCHMPEREHTFKGVHDPETFRQGLAVAVAAAAGEVRVTATNVGAGHYLPTTATPAAWIEIEPVDAAGRSAGAPARKRIGRLVRYEGEWKEVEDTRIPPGKSLAFSAGVAAPSARVRVIVAPDDYYEGFYRALLRAAPPAPARRLLEAALRRATESRYVAWERTIALR